MTNFSPIDYLDKVLFSFDSKNRNRGSHNLDISNRLGSSGLKISHELMTEILRKLVKDGYLRVEVGDAIVNYQTHKNIDYYLLTFEGELFQNEGGYTAKILDARRDVELQQRELDRLRNVDDLSGQNQTRLNRLTGWLVVGTIAAAIVGVALLGWQIYVFYHPEPIPVEVKVRIQKTP